jgi:alpha-galactosidase
MAERATLGDPRVAGPRIAGPRIAGLRPGRPFIHRVGVIGGRPEHFDARGLPAGLAIDARSGVISGRCSVVGRQRVDLTCTTDVGLATGVLTLVVGDRIALTPPMGWNSWNAFGPELDEDRIRRAAEALIRTGLADHGFTTVNLDDGWQGGRDRFGRPVAHDGFGDPRRLTDDLHASGLRVGIYSSPGPLTCAGFAGSAGHETIDAATWAAWGFDYLKYDWCSYRPPGWTDGAPIDRPGRMAPYRTMRAALDAVDRDIVYSLCQYGRDEVWRWGGRVGGDLWRTTGDIEDTWASVAGIGFGQAGLDGFAGRGRWNDPDMLVLGVVGWGTATARQTRLSADEQRTHLTLWCLLAAPLLLGCDLDRMDASTLELLTNDEVLAVDQDPLGRQGSRAWSAGSSEAWLRPLIGRRWALGLFNRGDADADVGVSWADVGLPKGARLAIRDLWARRDLGIGDGWSTRLPAHGSALLRLEDTGRRWR